MKNVWKWIEHNRFAVILPTIALILWLVAVSCTLTTISPLTGQEVTAKGLARDYQTWQNMQPQFDLAQQDLAEQLQAQSEFLEILTKMASGNVADWPGLVQLVIGGGFSGFLLDNIRKNGVIGGLKRNRE